MQLFEVVLTQIESIVMTRCIYRLLSSFFFFNGFENFPKNGDTSVTVHIFNSLSTEKYCLKFLKSSGGNGPCSIFKNCQKMEGDLKKNFGFRVVYDPVG